MRYKLNKRFKKYEAIKTLHNMGATWQDYIGTCEEYSSNHSMMYYNLINKTFNKLY